jgi:hypothetical protein
VLSWFFILIDWLVHNTPPRVHINKQSGFKVKDAMEQVRVVGRGGVVLHEKFR